MWSATSLRDFFQHCLNVKLTGNDLFNGGINHVMLYSNRMMFRKMEDNDSRCVQLSLRSPRRSIKVLVPVMLRRTDSEFSLVRAVVSFFCFQFLDKIVGTL